MIQNERYHLYIIRRVDWFLLGSTAGVECGTVMTKFGPGQQKFDTMTSFCEVVAF